MSAARKTAARKSQLACLIGLMFAGAPAWAAPTPPAGCQPDGHDCVRGKMIEDGLVLIRPDTPANSEREEASADGVPSDARRMLSQTAPATPPQMQRVLTSVPGQDDLQARFESGRSGLLPDNQAELDRLIAQLAGKSNLRFELIGHTDNQRLSPRARAIYRDNQGLSEARALQAATYLRERLGIPTERFSVSGRADREPVADNGTPGGMAKNRRVEIHVWYEQTAIAESAPAPAAPADGSRSHCAPVGTVPMPFRITVDGVPVQEGQPVSEADARRCTDVALDQADIQVKYDDLAASPALNAWTDRDSVPRGTPVRFRTYSNYLYWLARAEIRLFDRHAGDPTRAGQGEPFQVLDVPVGGEVAWSPAPDAPADLIYVLRVYDRKGRFDETAAKPLHLTAQPLASGGDLQGAQREALVGWGENSRQLANIPVSGGTVTISGTRVPDGHRVVALGAEVPVDAHGRFAVRQILPGGPQSVAVSVLDPQGAGMTFRRNLTLPDKDWFFVAVGDLTVGANDVTGPAKLVTGDEHYDDKTHYIDGRGAFYLKGKIKGEYLLTMSADTGEQPFEDLFSNFASKDPRYLLRRIDPDQYYPIYGDDSTLVDDAPTQGKFYVKLERSDSHIMWGNFKTSWTGTELTQYSRGLYGLDLQWYDDQVMPQGSRQTAMNLFAAEPGTLSSREAFRGTGGSLYYLRHLDLTTGSERVWVEVRDASSDMVLQRRQLVAGQDYDINYLQGRITLSSPLSSTADASTLVQAGSLAGNPAYLVVTYEYVPGLESLDGMTYGLRATRWLGEHLRLGVTGYRQGEGGADQRLQGMDLLLRKSEGSYLQLEDARSRGDGSASWSSLDGGFSFDSRQGAGQVAGAVRVEGALDLADLMQDGKGHLKAYYQQRDRDFSGPGLLEQNGEAVTQQGFSASLPLGETASVDLKADQRLSASQDYRAVEADLRIKLSPQWALSGGVKQDDRNVRAANASATLSEDGSRTDMVVRADYTPQVQAADGNPQSAEWNAYGYAQATVDKSGNRSDNDRLGIGGGWQLSERLRLNGEVSGGDGGAGGKLGIDWRINDRSNAYLQFTQESERPDLSERGRTSTWVTGGRYRMSDQVNLYAEDRFSRNVGSDSLTHAFGVDLSPSDRWTLGGRVETGRVSDTQSGDLDRDAISLSAAYKQGQTKFASALELRDEHGNQLGHRRTWLMRNSYGTQLDPAWRGQAKLNLSYSEASQGAYYDGDYVEAVLGAAYRPVDNDRWNTLFKYTYFYNLPSPGQVQSNGGTADYAQRSHVLSVDTIYDWRRWLSLGAKYALRIGELRDNRDGGDWFSSRADLWVLRADWHFVHEWDALVEWRRLHAREAGDSRQGWLLAVYRHLDENVKVGVGYNFTRFSDNLTDLSYRSKGWFLNVLATY